MAEQPYTAPAQLGVPSTMYDGPTYFAWFVLALLFFVVVGLIVWLGSMPRKLALKRNNPQVDAINACSWWGLAFGGVGWAIAFVWAMWHTDSTRSANGSAELSEETQLADRVKELEVKLEQITAQLKQEPS